MPETDAETEHEPTKDDLDQLHAWLAKMPHLVQDYDDNFLTSFVRGCKGSLQRTKIVLENFSSLGIRYPEVFGDMNPLHPALQEHLSSTYIIPLPKKTQDGSTIILGCFRPEYQNKPYEVHGLEFYRYWLLILHVQIWENNFGNGKFILLFDCRHCSLTHMRDFTPVALKKLLGILKTSVPVRIQGIHCIYLPPFLEWTVNLAKAVAKAKLGNRIFCHSSMESCYQKISQDLLPKEFGGNQDSIPVLHARYKKKVESYKNDLLETQQKQRVLDHLRPKTFDVNEMEGTFRSLSFD